jgi:hypothetical protein
VNQVEKRTTLMVSVGKMPDGTAQSALGFRSPVDVYSELLHNMELAKTATKH